MFKINPVALTAALFGLPAAFAQDPLLGCHPAYSPGATYASSAAVSASVTEQQSAEVACNDTDPDCSGGTKTVTSDVSVRYNYVCTGEPGWCSSAGYGDFDGPTSHWTQVWTQGAACDNSLPVVQPEAPPLWSGAGCPAPYVGSGAAGSYPAGTPVAVATDAGFSLVYSCTSDANMAQFCGMDGYAPGSSQYWEQAWTLEGSCAGTLSPSATVVPDAGGSVGGCPGSWAARDAAAPYAPGERVSNAGLVYECHAAPLNLHCGQGGYEPGASLYWAQAWTLVGSCSGTIAPTASPSFDPANSVGGCPGAWEIRDPTNPYEEGDRVAADGVVYACKGWPLGLHCGQDGYEPNADPATPDAWKDAWEAIGHCSGSIAPTTSPSFDPAGAVGACPPAWEAGHDHTYYQPEDTVSVEVSASPLRKVAYMCKNDIHLANNCALYAPADAVGGALGWEFAGSCDGSMGPTASPSFDALAENLIAGCPAEYSAAKDDYEAEEQVTVVLSAAPERKVVYECKKYPFTGYCNQFAPDAPYGNLGWELQAACTGTQSPTASPVAYANGDESGAGPWSCEYDRCRTQDVNTPCTYQSYGGDYACLKSNCGPNPSCTTATNSGGYEVETCTGCSKDVPTEVCAAYPVKNYGADPIADYEAGDVVRIGAQRYKVRAWPNALWAPNEAYKPCPGCTDYHADVWKDAWVEDGACA